MTLQDIIDAQTNGTVTHEMVDLLVAWVNRLGEFAEYMGPRNGWVLPDDFDNMMNEYRALKGN